MKTFSTNTKLGFILFSLLNISVATAGSAAHEGAHWGYSTETGPAHWGDMKHEFSTCKSGKKQSPIDIHGATTASLPKIAFSYQATPLNVVNNGHTIQVNYAPGSKISVNGKQYELLQFHFHSPSEHEINGKPADMVAHLVHKSADGQLGVIGVLMKKGESNPLIEKIWKHMPKHEGEYSQAVIKVNVNDLLPAGKTYYNYSGSLTTPPCSEGVNWMVLKNTVEVSAAQVAAFTDIFHKSTRPVQPLNGRIIKVAH